MFTARLVSRALRFFVTISPVPSDANDLRLLDGNHRFLSGRYVVLANMFDYPGATI